MPLKGQITSYYYWIVEQNVRSCRGTDACMYYRQEGKELCLLTEHARKLLGPPFQSQAARWQAEVFSSKCLSVTCNTQRQLSFTCIKGFFRGLHMNVLGPSVYKANVSSTAAFQSTALTGVSKQKWRVARNILTINGTEIKYILVAILK